MTSLTFKVEVKIQYNFMKNTKKYIKLKSKKNIKIKIQKN